ncbi:MAG: hypothetical protein IJI27_00435 [Oscillospiraceae bacterium]|nr:hypothetical protein [Oscillospiraceae bacterium]
MNQTKKLSAGIVWIAGIVSVIVSVLALVGKLRAHQSALVFIWVGVFYALALYYGLKGYQRPHGNMVQALMLIFAFFIASTIIAPDQRWGVLPWIVLFSNNLAAVFSGYMAGRLQKAEENRITAAIVGLLLFVRCLWFLENPVMPGPDVLPFLLARGQALLMWLTLVLIYFYRYQEHREAGLTVERNV